jgi:hypothetical protein
MMLEGVPPPSDHSDKQRDQEKAIDDGADLKPINNTPYIDPFGDEQNAEVKYKTLKWWYVLHLWHSL